MLLLVLVAFAVEIFVVVLMLLLWCVCCCSWCDSFTSITVTKCDCAGAVEGVPNVVDRMPAIGGELLTADLLRRFDDSSVMHCCRAGFRSVTTSSSDIDWPPFMAVVIEWIVVDATC